MRFDRNRAKLTQLIYVTGSFAKKQIISDFSRLQKGDIVIDGRQTIPEYLEELAESGALVYDRGQYHVTTPRR